MNNTQFYVSRLLSLQPYVGKFVTIREIVNNSQLLDGFGLNPYCINEGRATGDEVHCVDDRIKYLASQVSECMKSCWLDETPPTDKRLLLAYANDQNTLDFYFGRYGRLQYPSGCFDDKHEYLIEGGMRCDEPILYAVLP